MTTNYIYLVHEREFATSNQNVFKIGKTKQENMKRIYQYPKGSILKLYIECQDCDKIETQLIKDFITKYHHRKDIGSEYFEGDFKQMVMDICNCINLENCIEHETVVIKNNIIEDPIPTIQVNDYGKERLDYLTFDKLLEIFEKKYEAIYELIKEVHFNPNFPENHNIIYKDKKNVLMKYENRFVEYNYNNLVKDLYNKKRDIIRVFARKNRNQINEKIEEFSCDYVFSCVISKSEYKLQLLKIKCLIQSSNNQN